MLKHFKDSCVYLLKRRTFVEEIFLITSKAKQRCLYSVHTNRTSPMTGASQFQRRFRETRFRERRLGFLTFRFRLSVSTKSYVNASAQGFYLQNHLCGQQVKHLSIPYLTVHHISLKHTVPYGGPRFSIFRKLNNKSYLII